MIIYFFLYYIDTILIDILNYFDYIFMNIIWKIYYILYYER